MYNQKFSKTFALLIWLQTHQSCFKIFPNDETLNFCFLSRLIKSLMKAYQTLFCTIHTRLYFKKIADVKVQGIKKHGLKYTSKFSASQ